MLAFRVGMAVVAVLACVSVGGAHGSAGAADVAGRVAWSYRDEANYERHAFVSDLNGSSRWPLGAG
jgi:TRAP-type C4-dicarboxylate transport system permease large subunit